MVLGKWQARLCSSGEYIIMREGEFNPLMAAAWTNVPSVGDPDGPRRVAELIVEALNKSEEQT